MIMSKLACLMSQIPKAYRIHFLVGFVSVFLLTFFMSYGLSVLCALVIGVLKELYDYIVYKDPLRLSEFVYTVSGGFVSGLFTTIIKIIIFGIF